MFCNIVWHLKFYTNIQIYIQFDRSHAVYTIYTIFQKGSVIFFSVFKISFLCSPRLYYSNLIKNK